jgi:uncharacterized membrane protein
MNRRSLIYRLTLVGVLLVEIAWLAFHSEFFAANALEQKFQRFGSWAPIFFIGVYALSTVRLFRGRFSRWSAAPCSAPLGELCGT